MYKIGLVLIITAVILLASPGDTIGYSALDYMSMKQRIMVDDYNQAHIAWSWMDYPGQTQRYGMLTFRLLDGVPYYYTFQVTPSWNTHLLLDITRDANPDMQRTIITYYYDPGTGYYSWIDIDQGNCWGSFPNNPQILSYTDYLWPMVAAITNGNIAVAMANLNGNEHLLSVSTDEGSNWQAPLFFDSCATHSHFVRGSHSSPKLIFTHTHFITDTAAGGQLDNDVYYQLSTDGGMTWGAYTNVTNYQPNDSVRAYADVCACFDENDNLHIVWAGRHVDALSYHEASKIFHWDEVNDTITVVNSPSIYYSEPGGWWIATASSPSPGAWRMPADHPQLIVDHTTGILYCLWLGNDDYNDGSAGGFFNGEIFGSYSTDGGLTWSDYVDLTNTRTPGAGPGQCADEDCMTANPFVVNDSIFITFIEDKDAGWYAQGEGTLTDNPVYCWVFPTSLIRTGMEEYEYNHSTGLFLQIAQNPFSTQTKIAYCVGRNAYGANIYIYDATGRLVKSIPRLTPYALRTTLCWYGDDQHGQELPAGIYFVTLQNGDQAFTTKVVKLK